MSPTYISGFVIVFGQLLAWLGIEVVSADLQTTVTTVSTVVLGLWIMYRRYAYGGINIAGVKK